MAQKYVKDLGKPTNGSQTDRNSLLQAFRTQAVTFGGTKSNS
jgi:hypothetical protein